MQSKTYTRSAFLRGHPAVIADKILTASAETTFAAGSVLMLKEGKAVLADNTVTSATLIGILARETTITPQGTLAAVILHADADLSQLKIASGATAATVAAVLRDAGIYAY